MNNYQDTLCYTSDPDMKQKAHSEGSEMAVEAFCVYLPFPTDLHSERKNSCIKLEKTNF